MSVKYVPVQWGRNKWLYDAVLIVCVVAYVWIFLALGVPDADTTRPVDGAIVRMRAFGSCAFLMLSVILCIGPLARLEPRFLPLLYNRRHFGVLTTAVALSHALAVLDWYYNFSPTPQLQALLFSNTSYGQLVGFHFEAFGLFALLALALLAATSHDFWLNFLSAPLWKTLHLLIYPAYAAVIAHVAFGYLQDTANPAFAMVVAGGAFSVAALHVAAFVSQARETNSSDEWIAVGRWDAIADGRAQIVRIAGNERAAVFRNGNSLCAVSNACAHQNGPLGEGRIIDGCITCPWHGFQYRPEDGCSPAPFTEKIPTYRLRLDGDTVLIHRTANAPGTAQPPLLLEEEVR